MNRSELELALRAILVTLRDYLSELVLIGGWVPYLHFRYGTAASDESRTSLTADADLLIPEGMSRKARPAISEILRQADFSPLGSSHVVWVRNPERGEKVEFLQQVRGPAHARGKVASVAEQPGLRALSLDHVWILERFTEVLRIPRLDDEPDSLRIRVPTLAAFVLNKTNTFNLRAGSDSASKAGKDLLYLRDVMAAGDPAVASVKNSLRSMLGGDDGDRIARYLARALVHLNRVSQKFHSSAAKILAERDGVDYASAQADVEGHLTDLVEFLERLDPED